MREADRSPRRLVALVESAEHVCCRTRLLAYRRQLSERGWELTLCPAIWSRGGLLRHQLDLRRADAVLLQRRLLPAWQTWVLRRSARTLILDIDDAVFYRDFNSRRPARSWQRVGRFRRLAAAADAVLAGNAFLAEQVRRSRPRPRVEILPTGVEPGNYTPAQHRRRGAIRVVWIGSGGNLSTLTPLVAGLRAAAERLPGLELRVVCDVAPEIAGLQKTWCPWSEARATAELADGDLGIAWLPDHPWSLGKCGLKIVQYMAAGLPVVANPIGVHRQLVEDGGTGVLVDSGEACAAAVVHLAQQPELRGRLGRAGRARVEERYAVGTLGARFVALLEELVGAQGGRAS